MIRKFIGRDLVIASSIGAASVAFVPTFNLGIYPERLTLRNRRTVEPLRQTFAPILDPFPRPTPPIVANLKAWFRADLGVTDASGHASAWADQSGTGDANKDLAQSTSSARPTINSSNSSYNNKPTLDFDTDDYMVSGTWSSALSQPYTMFFVGNHGTSGLFYHGLDSNDGASYLYGLFGNTYMNAGADLADAVDITSPQVVCAVYDNTSGALYASKKTPVTGTVGTGGLTGTTVGSAYTVANFWGGPIAEIIIYSGSMGTTDRNTTLDYLGARYAITIGS